CPGGGEGAGGDGDGRGGGNGEGARGGGPRAATCPASGTPDQEASNRGDTISPLFSHHAARRWLKPTSRETDHESPMSPRTTIPCRLWAIPRAFPESCYMSCGRFRSCRRRTRY